MDILQKLSKILDRMSKPELLDLARKYNKSVDKIPNVHKLKKEELKVELLSRHKKVYKVWAGTDKPLEKGKRKKKEVSESVINELISKKIELNKKAIVSESISEKMQLLKEAEKIEKQISKLI